MKSADSTLALVRNEQLPPNMVAATPERLKMALLALQAQARSASELVAVLRHGGNAQAGADNAAEQLRASQEIIKTMPRECFIVVEGARLLGKPIPDITLRDLAFTGLIALNI